MSSEAIGEQDLNTVSLDSAVFCVNCEMISNSRHDVCDVCGSRSLVGLIRVLGGTLRKRRQDIPEKAEATVKYHLELSCDVQNISARDLNHAVEMVSHLAKAGGVIRRMQINVESVVQELERPLLKAA
jgi:hypothetical protein